MKNQIKNWIIIGFIMIISSHQLLAQGFNYQAVIRDADGQPIASQPVGLRVTLQNTDGTTIHYSESHSVTSSPQGVIALFVGEGNVIEGVFAEVPWSAGEIYLKVEVDPTGESNYSELGTTKLNAVPFALFAADGNQGPQGEMGPQGEPGENGVSIQWLGTLAIAPTSPELNQAYYNNTDGKSYIYNGTQWQQMTQDGVSGSGTLPTGTAGQTLIYGVAGWSASSNIYTGTTGNVGIGTTTPESKLDVAGDIHTTGKLKVGTLQEESLEDPLFVVHNSEGLVVFAVYEKGIRMYVDSDTEAKGSKGGFAVGGLTPAKNTGVEYFRVTPDSVRIYIEELSALPGKSGSKGGFAVGGLTPAKATPIELMLVTTDSTTITTINQTKKVAIRNPEDNHPLLNVEGSLKMGVDESMTPGAMSFDGTKFFTYADAKSTPKQFVVTGAPEVSTGAASSITRSSVAVAGNVLSDGGSEVVACGFCWGTTANPTLANSSQVSGSGVGAFTSNITGLLGSTHYYIRAFATNSQFTNYGEAVEVTTLAPELPRISSSSVTSITSTSAVSGGTITDDGSATITARGVCWNDTGNPDITDSFTTNGTGSGEFASSITGLTANKTYFVRAYATNSVGTSYGEERTFATTDLPVLSTNPITAVTGTTATSGGNIFAGGDLAIIQRGVCWNTSGNPTLENSFTENGSGTGSFVSNITGLALGTTYFVRAYATNATGTAYGNEYYFTTLNVPSITTDAVTMVTGNSAMCGGNITNNGGAVVTERGICWGISPDPTIDGDFITIGDGSGTFSSSITDLTIGTNYYVRAYAINNIGIAYGNQQLFTTQNFATVVTSEVYDITYTTAKGGGIVTSDGGATITQRGVCWNTDGTPTLEHSFTNDGDGTGEFISTFTGLAANNTYYVRAYVVNEIGTTYGNEVSFSTPTIVPPPLGFPTVGTVNITTAYDGYHTGGYVMSDGGSAITKRGVCWSTSPEPTIGDNLTDDGAGTGLYASIIESLAGCGQPYYVRAYATNSSGTGYGNQLSTVSGALIVFESTTAVTDITKTTAVSGGNITSDGGCAITERGLCWSRFQNPTIEDFKVASGSGIGSYSVSMTNLYPNETYYVRAYGVNSVATIYGPEVTFTTEAGSLELKIGDFYAGGYIFHLDETGDHGLVCAVKDTISAPWGCTGTIITTGTAVGTGKTNTAAIMANCTEEGIAARICFVFESYGYTDWFLPSLDEWTLIYNHLILSNIGGLSVGQYWTSSECDANTAYSNGFGNFQKQSGFKVRAVREF